MTATVSPLRIRTPPADVEKTFKEQIQRRDMSKSFLALSSPIFFVGLYLWLLAAYSERKDLFFLGCLLLTVSVMVWLEGSRINTEYRKRVDSLVAADESAV